MTLATLLAQFGIRQPFVLEREFVTALGAPKAVVRIETSGERLFIGSLSATWPSIEHVNAVFPMLNHVSRSLTAAHGDVAIGRYLRTYAGNHIVHRSGYHQFVRPHFDDVSVDPLASRHLHARALGVFHEHGLAAVHAAGRQNSRSVRCAARYRESILPHLQASRETELGHAAGPLREGIARMALIAGRHADDLDRLPVFLTHSDYQSKNILTGPGSDAGRPRVCIIDTETAQLESRLSDLYFLLMESDFGTTLDDFAAFRALLGTYFEYARGLTGEEARLLGFALQTKAARVAAWVASEHGAANPAKQSLYKTWYVQALRCIQVIDEQQDAIRDIAQAHRALPRGSREGGDPPEMRRLPAAD